MTTTTSVKLYVSRKMRHQCLQRRISACARSLSGLESFPTWAFYHLTELFLFPGRFSALWYPAFMHSLLVEGTDTFVRVFLINNIEIDYFCHTLSQYHFTCILYYLPPHCRDSLAVQGATLTFPSRLSSKPLGSFFRLFVLRQEVPAFVLLLVAFALE